MARSIGGKDDPSTVGRKVRVRVRMLRRVDVHGAIVIGAMIGAPVIPGIGRIRQAKRLWLAFFTLNVEHLQSDIGIPRVRHHHSPSAIDHGVPGILSNDRADRSCQHVDADESLRPVHSKNLHGTRAPRLVNDPLLLQRVSFINQLVVRAISANDPDARMIGPRIP